MPLPNDADRFEVSRSNTGMWQVLDRRGLIDTMGFVKALSAQWVCDAMNLRDNAESAVRRYECRVESD